MLYPAQLLPEHTLLTKKWKINNHNDQIINYNIWSKKKKSTRGKGSKARPAKVALLETTGEDTEKSYPVIGIGASAGGLEAIEEFFHNVSEKSGMAFVVISHTDPGRTSLLPDIIQRKINIPVIQVEEGMKVSVNAVFLPPSNRDLILEGNVFHLKE